MTETEIKMVLAILRQNYKNAKISDPTAEVALWFNSFKDYPAEVIRIAAEFHMKTSAFFPTIAEITNFIPRAEILRQFEENNKPRAVLEDPKTKAELRAIVTDIIDRENGVYVDFLDFER